MEEPIETIGGILAVNAARFGALVIGFVVLAFAFYLFQNKELWPLAFVLAFIGGVAFLFGVTILWTELYDRRKELYFKKFGVCVVTTLQNIEIDEAEGLYNGEKCRRLVSRWVDPTTQAVHLFRSEEIWFDPTDYLDSDAEIDVYIKRGNPGKYYVDTAFLPETEDLMEVGSAFISKLETILTQEKNDEGSKSYTYWIVSRWQDPKTGETHEFRSDELYVDPTKHIRSKRVKVFFKPGNPYNYIVDTSFLRKYSD